MAARNYDLVMVNDEAIRKDLDRFGIDMKALSRKMGKHDAFISATIHRGKVTRDLVEGIEDALFADRGKYTIELEEAAERPSAPQEAKLSEGMGILLKQIVGAVNAVSEKVDALDKTEELVKTIKEANEANMAVLQEILQKQKEMTTLAARILSNMERRQG